MIKGTGDLPWMSVVIPSKEDKECGIETEIEFFETEAEALARCTEDETEGDRFGGRYVARVSHHG